MFNKGSVGSQGSCNKLVDFAAINEAACVNGRSLIQELIPGGKFVNLDEYIVRSPTNDKPPGFFSIGRNGKWHDFTANEGGGDFVSLVAYLRCCSHSDAALELAAKINFIASRTCTTSAEEEAACEARSQGVNENKPPDAAQQQKKPVIVGRDRLRWRKEGDHLYLYHRSSRRPLVAVVPDSKYPGMFRVRYPNGALSDFVNLTRAKDAAAAFALRRLNTKAQESAAERPDARQKSIRVSEPPPDHSRGAALRNGFLAISGREP